MREGGQDSERNAGADMKEKKKREYRVWFKNLSFIVIFESFQGVVTNFEIFRMREKQVPVDVVEMKGENRGK